MKFIDKSLLVEPSNLRHTWGDKFFMNFDEHFGILYIDLKMISGACRW